MRFHELKLMGAVMLAGVTAVPLAADVIKETAPLYTRVERAVAVPAELRDQVLFVNVRVNGQGPFRVFVDTGCSVTIFSPEVAEAVKARPAPDDEATIAAFNALGGQVPLRRALLASVEVGGVRFEGVVAGIVPMTGLKQIDGQRVDGALGFSLFSDVVLGLDYPGHRLLLGPGWPEPPAPLRAELRVREHAEVPFVTATLQGRAFEVEIDSGSTGNLHLPADLAAGLSWKTAPRPGPLIEALNEQAKDYLGRLDGRLVLGGLVLPEPVASVGSEFPSIGYDVLSRFCVAFDQRSDQVRFYSAQAGPFASPPERSVGLSVRLDPNGWRVVRVIPGSPAEEARISSGDLITRLEGEPARDWSHDQLHDWIATHKTMRLQVVSGDSRRDLSLRSWLLVP